LDLRNRLLSKVVLNGLLGSAALILVNMAGAALGIHLALNIVSVYIAGFLGVPGIVLLAILKSILK
jgi:inhibitor of the pro-sigma K processing machinery